MTAFTEDRFLGGRIVAKQPADGFRSGLDAVMLAAAVPAAGGEDVLELGCGAAVAGLCLAARVQGCTITGIDSEAFLVSLAGDNARTNTMASRFTFVAADALSAPPELRRNYDHVFCNPPFHDGTGPRSPSRARATALHDDGQLRKWLASGLKRVRGKGSFTVIVRADRLGQVLADLPPYGVTVFPLWPSEDKPASRIVVQIRKNSRAPPCLLPGLILHEKDGRYTPEADAVLRHAGSLALARCSL
jgi:tRNA1Val (adenine37-N6)-methyltransferase